MFGLRSALLLLFVVAVSARYSPRQEADIENDDESARFTSFLAHKLSQNTQSNTQRPCPTLTVTLPQPTTPSFVTSTPTISTVFVSPTAAPIPPVIAGPQTPNQVTQPVATAGVAVSRDENEDGDEFEEDDEEDFEDEDFQELQAADESAELRKTRQQNAYYRQRLAQVQRASQVQRARAAARAANARRRNQMRRRRAAKKRNAMKRRRAIKKRNQKIQANNIRRRRRLANSGAARRVIRQGS